MNLETANIGLWGELLTAFKTLTDKNPPPESIRGALEAIKLKAENADKKELSYRQKDAIMARCDNYLSGEYGKTKTPENLAYQHKGTPQK